MKFETLILPTTDSPATRTATLKTTVRRRLESVHWLLAVLAVLLLTPGLIWAGPANLRGSLGTHDPSTIIKCNGRYYEFNTGQGISSKSSADKTYWVIGPAVFASPPSWTTSAVPRFSGFFWAPDVILFNGQYHLYYAVSTFGSQVSAIGLATNPTLDPSDPSYHWTDQGPVIQSTNGYPYNCIDPSVTFDASSNLWMSFGSYWNGIYLVQLDATTGLRNTSNTATTHLAVNYASGDPIEASCIYHHGSYYYLFVDWGTCCSGIDSTYNIRVGRSSSITGPYRDRNNASMLFGGGSLFLKTTGKYIGPGHAGILNEGNTNYFFSYHYYDADANGASMLDLEPLTWTSDGWPASIDDWSAVYRFQFDGRDDNGEYYGLLENGASVHEDPVLGGVLNLDGSNQYVSLPPGAGNALSIISVFKWNGGADWQRIFDFGRDTNRYAFLTPAAYNAGIRFAINIAGNGIEQQLNAPNAAPVGAWTQVAVTTDGSRGILYVNGAPVATNNSMSLTLPDIAPTQVWLGRSQFPVDPYFNGQISSVRIFGRTLSADEIVAPQAFISAPVAKSHYQPGETIQFAGSGVDFADQPLSSENLSWTIEFHNAGTTNVILGPLSGVSDGSFTIPSSGPESTNGFYRIALTAADTLGRKTTSYRDIFPGPANADWIAFYPFDNGAADSNGSFNGTLVSGATTPSDSIRGPVLNLNGSGQYVDLPSGIGEMRTFAAWVKWSGSGTWGRIFDFGTGTSSYAMLTARANNGALRFEITPNGRSEIRDLDAPNPLPVNVWTHVAVTLDGREAVMFINGKAVAVNASVNLLPSDVMGNNDYLGRSQFSNDSYFGGQMDSVEISSQTLPIEQITASSLEMSGAPPNVILNWPAFDNGLELHSSASLGASALWTPVGISPLATNGINFLTISPANNQTFYRLQLP